MKTIYAIAPKDMVNHKFTPKPFEGPWEVSYEKPHALYSFVELSVSEKFYKKLLTFDRVQVYKEDKKYQFYYNGKKL